MKYIIAALLITPALSFATAFFDKKDVQKRIEKNQKTFYSCYNKALKKTAGLEGSLTLIWDINETGKVVRAEAIQSTLNSPEAETCMVEAVKGIRFGPAPAGQIVSARHPFHFTPKQH